MDAEYKSPSRRSLRPVLGISDRALLVAAFPTPSLGLFCVPRRLCGMTSDVSCQTPKQPPRMSSIHLTLLIPRGDLPAIPARVHILLQLAVEKEKSRVSPPVLWHLLVNPNTTNKQTNKTETTGLEANSRPTGKSPNGGTETG